MAFNSKALCRMGESFVGATNVKSCFFYATSDAAAAVAAAGYFNNARDKLRVGDVIIASLDTGGAPDARTYVVASVPASGDVTVTLGKATAAT